MQKPARITPVKLVCTLCIVIVVFGFLIYRYPNFYDIPFWQNAVSNFIATFLGLVFGIPIALWINDFQQAKTTKLEKSNAADELAKRKKKVLSLIEDELKFNHDALVQYTGGNNVSNFDENYYVAYKVKNDLWRAFSDGGELQCINDADLMNFITWAYYSIERLQYSGRLSITYRYIDKPRTGQVITEHLEKQFKTDVETAKIDIERALDRITLELDRN